MKDNLIIKIILSLAPLFFLLLNIFDLYELQFGNGSYPFGSEFFPSNSIYQSRNKYLLFNCLFTISLIVTILFIWKQKWFWATIFYLLIIGLLLYPIYTQD